MADPSDLPWLLDTGGSAAVAMTAGLALEQINNFRRHLARSDDLSTWIRHAVGDQFYEELDAGEVHALRRALQDELTWTFLGDATADRLADAMSGCFDRRTDEQRANAGLYVARRLYESTLHFGASPIWAQVLDAHVRQVGARVDQVATLLEGEDPSGSPTHARSPERSGPSVSGNQSGAFEAIASPPVVGQTDSHRGDWGRSITTGWTSAETRDLAQFLERIDAAPDHFEFVSAIAELTRWAAYDRVSAVAEVLAGWGLAGWTRLKEGPIADPLGFNTICDRIANTLERALLIFREGHSVLTNHVERKYSREAGFQTLFSLMTPTLHPLLSRWTPVPRNVEEGKRVIVQVCLDRSAFLLIANELAMMPRFRQRFRELFAAGDDGPPANCYPAREVAHQWLPAHYRGRLNRFDLWRDELSFGVDLPESLTRRFLGQLPVTTELTNRALWELFFIPVALAQFGNDQAGGLLRDLDLLLDMDQFMLGLA